MMFDSIGDFLTRIRNANLVYKEYVDVGMSRINTKIAEILKNEGFIKDFKIIKKPDNPQPNLRIYLKYEDKKRIITQLQRVSRPSCRVYMSYKEIPRVMGGAGIAIISTSKGILTDKEARKQKVGGEVICYVW